MFLFAFKNLSVIFLFWKYIDSVSISIWTVEKHLQTESIKLINFWKQLLYFGLYIITEVEAS